MNEEENTNAKKNPEIHRTFCPTVLVILKRYNVWFSKENVSYQNCQVKGEKTIIDTKKCQTASLPTSHICPKYSDDLILANIWEAETTHVLNHP